MKKLVLAASVALLVSGSTSAAPPAGPPATLDELKEDRLKSLIKRDPRAQDLIGKVEAKLQKLESSESGSSRVKRMRHALEQITMSSSSVAEPRCRGDVDLLEAIAREHTPPSDADLAPLKERYRKIVDQFDDLALNKDLDRAFHIHDKLIRYTSMGLWDKDKIASELERMETLLANAPDIPYGRAEMVNGYKNKRLGAVAKLVYIGSYPHEELYLTGDRRSVGLVEEGVGGAIAMETADHIIDGPDGKTVDITTANNPANDVPFSPPLSLWMKSRILEGRVPAVTFRLANAEDRKRYESLGAAAGTSYHNVQDVLDGKLDDFFRMNFTACGASKTAALVGFLSDFDREAAADAFGADGKTPYYFVADPKLKALSGDKLAEELKKRLEKGAFSGPKSITDAMMNQYGEPAIPDGPERVKDAWKKVAKLNAQYGGETVAFYSSAGAFHGNKNAGKLGCPEAGSQAWNKLEYYWPGEGVLDWVGINAVGSDPVSDPKGANLMESIDPFMTEARTSSFQSTPVMLRGLAPAFDKSPLAEASWITTVFQKMLPATFPNISIVFLNVPDHLTLWSREGASAYRTNVSSNKAYKYPLRFKVLGAGQKTAE